MNDLSAFSCISLLRDKSGDTAKSGADQLLGIRYLPFETARQVYLPYQQTITPNCVNTESKCVCLPPTLENYENAQSWLISTPCSTKGSCSTEIH